MAILEENDKLDLVMDKTELGQCKGDAKAFLEGLRTKGVLSSKL